MVDGSVLDPQRHSRIILDIENVCARANIPRWALHESLADYEDERVVQWVRDFRTIRQTHRHDLALSDYPDTSRLMMLMCGALIRNYIDARVMVVQEMTGTDPGPTVLLCPNFHTQGHEPEVAKWLVPDVLAYLYRRDARNQVTVLGIGSRSDLEFAWGPAMLDHLKRTAQVLRHRR